RQRSAAFQAAGPAASSRGAPQNTTVHPALLACSFEYDTPSTVFPAGSRSTILSPLFDSCIGAPTVIRTASPDVSFPPSWKRLLLRSASTQPLRSTSAGETLSNVTVSIS